MWTKKEKEQAELSERVKALKHELNTAKKETTDIATFMRLVKKYTEITELMPKVVRSFINKILVHAKRGSNVPKK